MEKKKQEFYGKIRESADLADQLQDLANYL